MFCLQDNQAKIVNSAHDGKRAIGVKVGFETIFQQQSRRSRREVEKQHVCWPVLCAPGMPVPSAG